MILLAFDLVQHPLPRCRVGSRCAGCCGLARALGQLRRCGFGGSCSMATTFLMPGRRARYKVVAAGSSMDVGWTFLHPKNVHSPRQIQRRQLLSGSPVVGTSVTERKPAATTTVRRGTFGNFRSRVSISREVANTRGPDGFFPAAFAPGLAGLSLGVSS